MPLSVAAMSATLRPTATGVSCDLAVGRMPVRETSPNVGRNASAPVATAAATAEIELLLVALLVPDEVASLSMPTVAAARPDTAAATAPADEPFGETRMS